MWVRGATDTKTIMPFKLSIWIYLRQQNKANTWVYIMGYTASMTLHNCVGIGGERPRWQFSSSWESDHVIPIRQQSCLVLLRRIAQLESSLGKIPGISLESLRQNWFGIVLWKCLDTNEIIWCVSKNVVWQRKLNKNHKYINKCWIRHSTLIYS